MAEWFLSGDNFGFLSEVAVTYVAFGLGLGAVVFLLGWIVYFIIQIIRF